jgi:hypothetical protein
MITNFSSYSVQNEQNQKVRERVENSSSKKNTKILWHSHFRDHRIRTEFTDAAGNNTYFSNETSGPL